MFAFLSTGLADVIFLLSCMGFGITSTVDNYCNPHTLHYYYTIDYIIYFYVRSTL